MRRMPIPNEYPVHLIRRGARSLPFVRSDADRWRNLQMLYYLNDSSSKEHWLKDLKSERGGVVDFRSRQHKKVFFGWPKSWPKRDPLVILAAFTFNKNHDHMIVWEKKKKGISQFMHKCGISISKYFNDKYEEQGTVLKPYSLKVIDSDEYLRWVVPYVLVKNTFEMHPKGYGWAINNFEEAWRWATHYPFSSLGDCIGVRDSVIVDTARLKELIGSPRDFKKLCKDMIMAREGIEEDRVSKILSFSFELPKSTSEVDNSLGKIKNGFS